MERSSAITGMPIGKAYVSGPVERFGRTLKVEYLGMASVYLIIGLLVFDDFPYWYEPILATLGAFFLFLGLKKKTEDHLVGSLVLFAATSLAHTSIGFSEWFIPYLLFGLTVFIMEGYREKRPKRIYALPVLFLGWSLADSSWWLGLVFSVLYLAFPRTEKPQFRRLLFHMLFASLVLGFSTHAFVDRSIVSALRFYPEGQVPLNQIELQVLAAIGIPALFCLALYWRRLSVPHRWNTLIFGLLAVQDGRLAALFGMVAAVLLCATVFRDSVDSPSMRPFFKHFEWHYFWYVFIIAVWALVKR